MLFLHVSVFSQKRDPINEIKIKKTANFKITGDGSSQNWNNTEWINIPLRSGTRSLETKAKILYSDSGIYYFFFCQDDKITSTMTADFLDLWKEDVVEVFLWPDESITVYFEYEISPLGYELPILISNENMDLVRWMPFHYDADRKTAHGTSVLGGEKKSNAGITAWTAEFYIPFKLLRPLKNISPRPGTKWRTNMYRFDYDDNNRVSFSWQLTERGFHDYPKFGTLIFE